MNPDQLIARVRSRVEADAPHLLPLLEITAGEARFARAWLDEEIKRLPPGAPVLEVGGGVFLLSAQLALEGFDVTALEPTGSGFGSFEHLGRIVLETIAEDAHALAVVRCPAEEFVSDRRYSLAFSFNVMEHVADPQRVIESVSRALRGGATHRFLCPNYLFPYEPHFNLPTVFGKSLTWRLLARRIEADRRFDDPTGLWNSLNWISVPRVARIARADRTLTTRFVRRTLSWMLSRAVHDEEFARRRSRWMVGLMRFFSRTGVLQLSGYVPATLQPVMDVKMTKRV